MKIIVDYDLCEGNAKCVKAAPELFELTDDDKAKVLLANPPASLRPKAEQAVRLCPRQAIAIED